MNINKPSLQLFRADFAATVKELEAKYDVKIELGSFSFNDDLFSGKMKVTNMVTDNGEKIDDKMLWAKDCKQIGLKAEDYGATVTVNGMNGKIVGIKLRSFKYPVIVQATDGQRYKLSANQVKLRLTK